MKDESVFGDGAWGGNKVRKLEWIIPEAQRRGSSTLFTVGGIGTHWGLACAVYAADHGLRTVLGLVDQPVDDHVRQQLDRLTASGARIHRYPTTRRLKLAAPYLLAKYRPWYLPAGGSNPFGTLAYVDVALEIAAQVEAGELPAPGSVVVPVGSGGTVAGLTVGFALAGLDCLVLGVVVNDMLRLDNWSMMRLANRTAILLTERGLTGARTLHRGRLRPAPPLAGDDVRRPDPGVRGRGGPGRGGRAGARARLHRQGAGRDPRPRHPPPGPGAVAQHPRSGDAISFDRAVWTGFGAEPSIGAIAPSGQ